MPSIQKRIVSVAEEIAALQARALKLETFPPNGATILGQGNGSAAATAFSATWANVALNYVTVAATLRPLPFLAIATVGDFTANAGVGTYTSCRFAVLNNNGPVANDAITGVPLTSGIATVAAIANEIGNATLIIAGVLPAGPAVGAWYFALQHIETGGAGGFNVPATVSSTNATSYLVLQLAG